MIRGIGTDIIENARILKSILRYGRQFLDRLFTQREQEYCNRHVHKERHYAGRFAAKEAIAKALGTGIGKELAWHDIEILNDAAGKPEVIPSPRLAERLQGDAIILSVSHCHDYATAVALWEERP